MQRTDELFGTFFSLSHYAVHHFHIPGNSLCDKRSGRATASLYYLVEGHTVFTTPSGALPVSAGELLYIPRRQRYTAKMCIRDRLWARRAHPYKACRKRQTLAGRRIWLGRRGRSICFVRSSKQDLHCLYAVSYTHLDVYKRQRCRNPKDLQQSRFQQHERACLQRQIWSITGRRPRRR